MLGKKKTVFKYNPNAYKNGIIIEKNGICQCCGKNVEAYVTKMYTSEDVDCICVDCVSSGDASKKFKGDFIQSADKVNNKDAYDELFHRTPGYLSWQGENWIACCNDYCEYLGTVGTKELEKLGIANELFEMDGSFEGWKDARNYLVKDGRLCGYLFRCLHCRKYHLRIDAD